MAYEVRVVDMTGTSFGTATNARVENVSWELNEAGAATIGLATTDADAALFQVGREVQIYNDSSLVFWGPIVRSQCGLDESSWQCAGLLWYFSRRYMGRSDRVNYLTNGDFEAGEDEWTFNNGVTHSIDTGTKVEGAQSLKLSGATVNHQQYAAQTMPAWTQFHPDGDALTVSTWVFIPSADYAGGAAQDLGLIAVHRDSTGKLLNHVAVEIGDDTEKDVWLPLEVLIPAVKTGDTVEVRLVPPHGVAYFDLVTLTAMESLVFWPGDIGDIIEGIVQYSQQIAPFDFGHNKSDLNIGVSAPTVGVTKYVAYQFAEHRNILDVIQEYVRQGLCDIDVMLTSPTERTFTVFAPTRGSLYGTTLELDVNVADFSWSWDGETAATSVVVLGPGDGPDRPEGGANDLAALGGLTLELIETAPDDVTVGDLDLRAAEILSVASNPVLLEVTTLPGSGIVGDLAVGDTVQVVISRGHFDIDAAYRVIRMEADLHTDQATLTLNAT